MATDMSSESFQSLKKILCGPYGEKKRMKMLKELEVPNDEGSSVLSFLIKIVSMTTNLVELKRLMMLFARTLMQHLDETGVLQKSDLSLEALQQVKHFWSLCFTQQEVFLLQTPDQWHPSLLEIATSLASVYIDLFLVAHRHAKDPALWSKRLFSWLTFDLNQRSLRTALLEVSCPAKKATTLLSPILRKVLAQPLEGDSPLDYLLHMLLVRKWAPTCVGQDVVEASRLMKAPKKFIPWLTSKWKGSASYVPTDKSLKGRRVSQFFLDVDTEAVESLIDVFSECLKEAVDCKTPSHSDGVDQDQQSSDLFMFDKSGSGDMQEDTEISQTADIEEDMVTDDLFVLDKTGSESTGEVVGSAKKVKSLNKIPIETSSTMRNNKRKHVDSEADLIIVNSTKKSDCYAFPISSSEDDILPAKKKRKTGSGDEQRSTPSFHATGPRKVGDSSSRASQNGFTSVEATIVEDSDEDNDDSDDNPLDLTDSDLEVLSEKETFDDADLQNDKTVGRSVDESAVVVPTSDEEDEGDCDVTEVERPRHIEKGGTAKRMTRGMDKDRENEGKKLHLSDPATSYFTSQGRCDKKDNVRVYDATTGEGNKESAIDGSIEIPSTIFKFKETVCQESHSVQSPKQSLRRRKTSSIDEQSGSEDSQLQKTRLSSPSKRKSKIQDEGSVPRMDTEGQRLDNKLPLDDTLVMSMQDDEDDRGHQQSKSGSPKKTTTEEEISRQLSNIRRSVSKKTDERKESPSTTPARMTTRLRRSGVTKNDDQESKASAAILQGWLRSPTQLKLPNQTANSNLSASSKRTKKSLNLETDDSGMMNSPKVNGPRSSQKVRKTPKSDGENQTDKPELKEKEPFPTTPKGRKSLTGSSLSKDIATPKSASKKKSVVVTDSASKAQEISSVEASSFSPPRTRKKVDGKIENYFPSVDRPSSKENVSTPVKSAKRANLNKTNMDSPVTSFQGKTPKTPIVKTPQTAGKSSSKKSPANRRKSLRSASNAESTPKL